MKDDELKPCPFCGGEAQSIKGDYNGERAFWRVFCISCQCRTWCEKSLKKAIKTWNSRQAINEDGEVIERLRNLKTFLQDFGSVLTIDGVTDIDMLEAAIEALEKQTGETK